MIDVSWQDIGKAAAAALVGAGGVFTWWSRRAAREARVDAEAAKADAEAAQAGTRVVLADAESQLYKLLVERMQALEANVTTLSQQLAEARQREQVLETHIFHLENLMRKAGMDVPERVRKLG